MELADSVVLAHGEIDRGVTGESEDEGKSEPQKNALLTPKEGENSEKNKSMRTAVLRSCFEQGLNDGA